MHRTCDSSEEVPAAAWEVKEGFLEEVIFTPGTKDEYALARRRHDGEEDSR